MSTLHPTAEIRIANLAADQDALIAEVADMLMKGFKKKYSRRIS
jgi:hypothetical protein